MPAVSDLEQAASSPSRRCDSCQHAWIKHEHAVSSSFLGCGAGVVRNREPDMCGCVRFVEPDPSLLSRARLS